MSDDIEKPEDPDESEHETTDRPEVNAKIQALGYALSVRFHPEIKLDRKRGHQFAAALADYVNLETNEFESHKWTFCEPLPGDPTCRFIITVSPNILRMDVRSQNPSQDWVDARFGWVLDKFREIFRPQVLLQSEATVRGTLPIDGDARTFLAIHVMGMKPDRVDSFGRPLHLLGLKFFFPPYMKKRKEGEEPQVTDWHVGVRAESWMEDPSKLFLEAEATWIEAHSWKKEISTELTKHLETVKDYLEKNVMQFLQTSPGEGDDETGPEGFSGDDPGEKE